ncbi:hypothetical protein [Ectopseudomonas oleovorans]|uniref:hypothetical protein n=1 Tax=Ectopseudomonas oleovorans TaxID=301 RepID=UPI0010BD264F|nr:hypothetical protein [Pseudomonas oleovorans]
MDVPSLEDSGSDGSQVAARNDIIAAPIAKPLPSSLVSTFEGLSNNNSRNLGGEVTSRLIAGTVAHLSEELNQHKRELNELRIKNETLREKLSIEQAKSAVMKERIDTFRSARHLTNIGLSLGSLFIGVGVPLIIDQNYSFGIILSLSGIVLSSASWIFIPKRGVE